MNIYQIALSGEYMGSYVSTSHSISHENNFTKKEFFELCFMALEAYKIDKGGERIYGNHTPSPL
jgi:hypothetical protein